MTLGEATRASGSSRQARTLAGRCFSSDPASLPRHHPPEGGSRKSRGAVWPGAICSDVPMRRLVAAPSRRHIRCPWRT